LSGVEIVDGSEAFAAARSRVDIVEQRLLERADAIAEESLKKVSAAPALTVGVAVGSVERQARLKGAEEVYVAIAPDLDVDRRFLRASGGRTLSPHFAMRASVAYKGAWIRHIKTYSAQAKDRIAIDRADAWFKTFLAGIDPRRALVGQITASVRGLSGAQLTGWMVETVLGTRPLATVASSESPNVSLADGPALIVTVSMTVEGVPWCGAGLAGARQEPSA